jgi:hypothetical protein
VGWRCQSQVRDEQYGCVEALEYERHWTGCFWARSIQPKMRSDVLQVRGRKLAALLMTYPQLIGVDVGAGTGQSSGGTEFYHQIVSPDLVGPPQLGDLRVVLSRRPPVHLVDHGGVGHHVVGQFELTKSSIDGFSHRLYVSQLLRPVVSVALTRRAISKGVRHHFAPAFAACLADRRCGLQRRRCRPARGIANVCAYDLSFIGPFDESIGRPFG